jgi:hypothetical protein
MPCPSASYDGRAALVSTRETAAWRAKGITAVAQKLPQHAPVAPWWSARVAAVVMVVVGRRVGMGSAVIVPGVVVCGVVVMVGAQRRSPSASG